MYCIADCGCAGAQDAATCGFEPDCRVCHELSPLERELLEALDAIRRMERCPEDTEGYSKEQMDYIFSIAKAAIAKAEGR